jgi:hypothetical protein
MMNNDVGINIQTHFVKLSYLFYSFSYSLYSLNLKNLKKIMFNFHLFFLAIIYAMRWRYEIDAMKLMAMRYTL